MNRLESEEEKLYAAIKEELRRKVKITQDGIVKEKLLAVYNYFCIQGRNIIKEVMRGMA